ncbi:MAG: carboxypeptidase regulatory-like domain-containing protein [Candidatus Hydrogenedentes bacterium]|nr:carboxypeptidase regulatory-like domain-containing protein [Candidatus Hydrogenedentota bacterium]
MNKSARLGRHAVFAAIAALLLVGCPPGTVPDLTGIIAGTVVDDDTGQPIANASVATEPDSAGDTSAADGTYQIADIPVGAYTVIVSATGYGTQEFVGVSVAVGQTTTLDARLVAPAGTTGAVTGTVMKHDAPDDTPLPGATVALVDATALAASDSQTPLETLAATSPYTALSDGTGAFEIEGVLPGSYFIHATPAAADLATVLPGGDSSRESFEVAAGKAVTTVDIVLSQQPSPSASFVGTALCLGCHNGTVAPDKTGYRQTLHALVYRAPDQASSIQDLSPYPNANAAHAYFKDGNERDNTGAGDEYGLRLNSATFPMFTTTNPADVYDVWLGFEEGTSKYFMQFSDAAGEVMSEKYYVEFTFGGHGVYKERWITRVRANGAYDPDPAGGDSSYYVLPVQFDENLQEGVEPFHPYNYTNWGPPAAEAGPTRTPAKGKSFDLNCAGCHFTGTTLVRDTNGLYHADAANTTNAAGIIDYDGDGTKDEMVIGCEDCHGPGSEHVTGGSPPKLVLSRYLSAERDAMLCGRCHTRGAGKGHFTGTEEHPEYPSRGTDTLDFPAPGIGYDEFVAEFHNDAPGLYGDAVGHSRQHHQQFVDLQKSTHYKNPYQLVGCSECHDLHNRDIGPSLAMNAENNELCLSCHAPYGFGLTGEYSLQAEGEAVSRHMLENAGMPAGYDPLNLAGISTATGGVGQCATCHMPKTAASQSRFIHEQVNEQGQPSGGRIRGDISSHVFDIVTPAASQVLFNTAASNKQMPNSCGSCHNTLAADDPDYAYKR